uniref:Uncharacterized protein n=1 Tax=Rhizophora mucronata TaxID=61149 RepID=A0A2P2PQT5_RHIMU
MSRKLEFLTARMLLKKFSSIFFSREPIRILMPYAHFIFLEVYFCDQRLVDYFLVNETQMAEVRPKNNV